MRIDTATPRQHSIMEMAAQPRKEIAEKQGPSKDPSETAKIASKASQAQQVNPQGAGSKIDILA
jgi:hypothetical protein